MVKQINAILKPASFNQICMFPRVINWAMYDLVDSLKIFKKGNVHLLHRQPEVQWEVEAFCPGMTDISLTFLPFAFWHKYGRTACLSLGQEERKGMKCMHTQPAFAVLCVHVEGFPVYRQTTHKSKDISQNLLNIQLVC